ncbi:non-hydrolyzing UDP-N-acetylglucosamine 2-epimerase [Lysobacter yangpyeongensis]|uniref:Non-hydrolyzing UDP-N-acetylglucosamine 2-epimerase n=1 Tax=Lysobacter yangpyeongensis TaxID=346182 RepID=A0ABW0SRP7_9GAMM
MISANNGTRTATRLDLVIGTRPNIIKAGPLFDALRRESWCEPRIVFLMQHTDPVLAAQSLEDVGINADSVVALALRETDNGRRLGEMLSAYTSRLAQDRPHLVLVFGDVDTTLAAAYAAKRSHIPVAHVEAGLRSYDRSMPEELNRLMVDAICDLHLATSRDAVRNLVTREGHAQSHVHFVGNLMIDALLSTADRTLGEALCAKYSVQPSAFALATFHRPSNVDNLDSLRTLVEVMRSAASRLPVLWPVHPRTRAALDQHDLSHELESIAGLKLLPPLRYREFVSLLAATRVALTDSGGLQEETSVLGIPCLTLRANTERPVTVEQGSNVLVEPASFDAVLDATLSRPMPAGAEIEGWDGNAADRIVVAIRQWLATSG